MTIDILSAIRAVAREVEVREHEGRPARIVRAARVYPTDVEDLWDAVTNPERIPRWFLPVSGDLRLGGRYQLQGNAGGEIVACESPRHLALTWVMRGETSWVNVRLTEHVDGAQLELEHIAHVPEEFWRQYGPGAVGVGWDLALYGLVRHIASGGAALDPQAAMAWVGSEEGKAFVRGLSDDWRRAAVAGGEDPAAAKEAAARTTAFYTGAP
jgi:uncharacterized protein YndB with AHSA1/START domain